MSSYFILFFSYIREKDLNIIIIIIIISTLQLLIKLVTKKQIMASLMYNKTANLIRSSSTGGY